MLQLEREAGGTALHGMSWNMWITGNSGSGKSKFVAMLKRYLRAYCAIDKDILVVRTASELMDSRGQSCAENVKQAFAEAVGGVFVIDDAHNLAAEESADDSVNRVTNLLLTESQRTRGQTVVVVCGLKDGVAKFMASNYGLESRFPLHVHIDDYTPSQLGQVRVGGWVAGWMGGWVGGWVSE